MTTRDIELLARRIDSLTRAAARLRRHLPDLHHLGWEPHRGEPLEGDTPGFVSSPPRTGEPRARHLWVRISLEIARCEDLLVGLERDMTGLFFAHSANPEPSRGSLISAAEHDRLLTKQRSRDDSPARLVDQPAHPGRKR